MHIIAFILAGLVVGYLANQIAIQRGMGPWGDIAVGIIGAMIAGLIFNPSGATYGSVLWSSILWAVLGAAVLLFIVRLAYKALGTDVQNPS